MESPPAFLSGESHGQRSLVGYSPWNRKSDATEQLTLHYKYCIRKRGSKCETVRTAASIFSECTCNSFFSLSSMYENTHKKVSYSLWVSLMLNSSLFVGKAKTWGIETAVLNVWSSSSDPFLYNSRLHACPRCCAVFRKFKRKKTFKKADDAWKWQVGCGVNRSQAFLFSLVTSTSWCPDQTPETQARGVSFTTFPFWWSSALSSFPTFEHLWRRAGSGKVAAVQRFPQGADAFPQPRGVTRMVTWTVSRASPTLRGLCSRLWWEGPLKDWPAQWFFCMWWNIYKHELVSCSLCGWDIELGPLVSIPSLTGREAQWRKSWEGVLTSVHHMPTITLDTPCYLSGPLTFLQQSKDHESEGFQEVLLLLWNIAYDCD